MAAGGAASLKDVFQAFSKFGDTKSDGTGISLSQSDKWMKQANVFDKVITTTDTGIHFKKFTKTKTMTFDDFNKFLEDMAKTKKIDVATIVNKMTSCGAPGVKLTDAGKAGAVTDRLTNTAAYTGASKNRFDESGKGKGIAGREEVTDNSGYVSGYKNKDTFDKK